MDAPFKRVFETDVPWSAERSGCARLHTEDGGRAMILDVDDNERDGMFVRVQSWSCKARHPEMSRLLGQRIRVTVEIIGPSTESTNGGSG